MMLAYAAHVSGITPSTPIVVATVTSKDSVKVVLVLSRSRPINGTDKTPPTGSATSKKLLISTALL